MAIECDVLGFGAVAVDDLLFVDEYPAPDSKIPVRRKERAGGGLAGTALVAAARLGQRAAYCGVLGDDDLSGFTLDEFRLEGVDVSAVIRRQNARPFHSVIIVWQENRCILYSNQGVTEPAEAELPLSLLETCRVLFVDYTVPDAAWYASRIVRKRGAPVVADLEKSDLPDLEKFLSCVDHLILGYGLAQEITGEKDGAACVESLIGRGQFAAVVVTAGADGCWFAENGGGVLRQPALKVHVVDTTGCGDVFHGAYAACLSWGGPVAEAVRTATVAAGLKALHYGGRAGIPDRQIIQRHLDNLASVR